MVMTDGRVLCAETVMNPLQMYITDAEAFNTPEDDDQLRFLFTLRYKHNTSDIDIVTDIV